ncbi:MAG: MBL fold metallo-hydrolase [Proteobacteria bacterium]|jgi:glyoxylase-like metal-dependent hydrolase (beta-lactamase superfamily II)|nr:MBL fold metallo-hydrolase [Pseudomonadota bacterium]
MDAMKPMESQGHAPRVVSFFDPETFTGTHVVIDEGTKHCALVDCVLDYDPKSGMTSTASADALIAWVKGEALTVDWILETHVHADHLSAAPYLQAALGGQTAIGSAVTLVQSVFKGLFNAEDSFAPDGSQFDVLFDDGATFAIGDQTCTVIHTPGHTPACVSYYVGDALFVGDTLFAPDFGTARCDFPGGDAKVLFQSVRKLLALPAETRVFLCHDYMPGGREVILETSIGAERANNIHVHEGVEEAAFVAMRSARDATLSMPVLILPSVQVNMRAGELPPAEANGMRYLKIPLNAF